ncbi:MAG: GNAT family N-acetyltransferase [Bacteroidetes bacterium]|nr:GNAT family N-acetyltransferase [Bacteroidota bacterium]
MSGHSENKYTFHRISKDTLPVIKDLYKNVFNVYLSDDFVKKKFNTSFAECEYIGYMAFAEDGTPAAYYGVFPCMIEFQNKKILAAQSGDTMTHPLHQGKGLFTKLAKATYELAAQEGIQFIFGFPNKNSYPGFTKKLNWIHKENMKSYIFRINTLPLIKIAKKFNLQSLYESFAFAFLKKYLSKKKSFSNSLIASEYGGLLHDDLFLNYKTYTKSFILDLEGVNIWIKLDGKLWIGDIEKSSLEQFKKALNKLQRICFWLGCTEIILNVSPNSYWDVLLQKEFSSSEGLPIGYLDLNSNINLDKILFTGGDFDTF